MSVINTNRKDAILNRDMLVASLSTVYCIKEKSNFEQIQTSVHSVLPEHLQELYKRSSENLSHSQANKLEQVLMEFQDIFMSQDGILGQTNVVEHTIDTGEPKPIKLPLRRVPIAQRQIVESELDKMLKQNIIEGSQSPWAAPVCLVKKKDGSTRFCIDYRQLNKVTRKDAFPLPRIDDTLDLLAGSQWFCTLDLASGYWQCKVSEQDKPKTALITHKGLYQFNVMPFGLCNAPATFSRMMDIVLSGMKIDRCLCYLDDLIVFGKTFESSLENLKQVFGRLKESNLKNVFYLRLKFHTEVIQLRWCACAR